MERPSPSSPLHSNCTAQEPRLASTPAGSLFGAISKALIPIEGLEAENIELSRRLRQVVDCTGAFFLATPGTTLKILGSLFCLGKLTPLKVAQELASPHSRAFLQFAGAEKPCAPPWIWGVSVTRYFFHIRDGDQFIEDSEGVEMKDATAAHDEASKAAREMLVEKLLAGDLIDGQVFEIVDDTGRLVERLPFKSVLKT